LIEGRNSVKALIPSTISTLRASLVSNLILAWIDDVFVSGTIKKPEVSNLEYHETKLPK